MAKHRPNRVARVATYSCRAIGNCTDSESVESTTQIGGWNSNLAIVAKKELAEGGREIAVYEVYSCQGYIGQPEGQGRPWRRKLGEVRDGTFFPDENHHRLFEDTILPQQDS